MKRRAVVMLLGVVLCLGAGFAWVRLAPSDPARWHRMPAEVQVSDLRNGAIRVIDGSEGTLAELDAIIRGSARTQALAGSLADGMITYVSRTALIGFPDYTTIRLRDGQIGIYGRARFGRSDLGVNAARIDAWLDALAQGG